MASPPFPFGHSKEYVFYKKFSYDEWCAQGSTLSDTITFAMTAEKYGAVRPISISFDPIYSVAADENSRCDIHYKITVSESITDETSNHEKWHVDSETEFGLEVGAKAGLFGWGAETKASVKQSLKWGSTWGSSNRHSTTKSKTYEHKVNLKCDLGETGIIYQVKYLLAYYVCSKDKNHSRRKLSCEHDFSTESDAVNYAVRCVKDGPGRRKLIGLPSSSKNSTGVTRCSSNASIPVHPTSSHGRGYQIGNGKEKNDKTNGKDENDKIKGKDMNDYKNEKEKRYEEKEAKGIPDNNSSMCLSVPMTGLVITLMTFVLF